MAGKGTTLNKALALWEEKNGMSYTEATEIKLLFLVHCRLTQQPPIEKLETTVLSTLTKVEKLSLSTNCIDKMVNFPPLKSLRRLSLSRNNIKKISGEHYLTQASNKLVVTSKNCGCPTIRSRSSRDSICASS